MYKVNKFSCKIGFKILRLTSNDNQNVKNLPKLVV